MQKGIGTYPSSPGPEFLGAESGESGYGWFPLKDKHPLSRKKIAKKFLAFLPSAALMLGIGFGFYLGKFPLPFLAEGLVAGGFALLAFGLLWSYKYYSTYNYEFNGRKGVRITKGWPFASSITIPFEKISDIYVDQDLLDRLLGLYDLHYSSASVSSGNLSHIDGLEENGAEALLRLIKGSTEAAKGLATGTDTAYLSLFPGKGAVLREIFSRFGIFQLWMFIVSFPLMFLLLPVGVFLLFASIGFAWLFAEKEVSSIRYELRDTCIHVRRGWLTPSASFIFYQNVQDLEVTQGLLDRFFSLSTVTPKSMSEESPISARMNLLSNSDAEKLVQELRKILSSLRVNSPHKVEAPASAALPPEEKRGKIQRPYNHRFLANYLVSTAVPLFVFLAVCLAVVAASNAFGFRRGLELLFKGENLIGFVFPLGFIAISLIVTPIYTVLRNSFGLSYWLERDALVIEYDFFTRERKRISFAKIQEVKISVGTMQSFLGIADIQIETGSKEAIKTDQGETTGSGVSSLETISALSIEDALQFRSILCEAGGFLAPDTRKTGNFLREEFPLSKRKILKKTFHPTVIFAAYFVGLAGINLYFSLNFLDLSGNLALYIFLGTLGFYSIGLVSKYFYERAYFDKYFYAENETALLVRKGVFGWSEIVIPYRNIQTVLANEDLGDAAFGLWDVWVTTVTSASGNLAHIDGVEGKDAEKLVGLLAARVEKSRKFPR